MKRGGGAGKGSDFERQTCKDFSLWISNGERDDIFWRTAGSGARATVRRRSSNISTCNSDGDMCLLDTSSADKYGWFLDYYMVEIKRGYNHWRIDDFFNKKPSKDSLLHIWIRALLDAEKIGKLPLVIWKADRRPTIYLLDGRIPIPWIERRAIFTPVAEGMGRYAKVEATFEFLELLPSALKRWIQAVK